MGRRKKYLTEEEKKLAARKRAHAYYWKNKEKCDAQARKRYRRNLQDNKP